MRKYILIAIVSLLFVTTVKSQDKIYRNNGKVIEVKVIEIGSSEVKYKEYNNQDGPIYVLETDRIKKIVFQNGTVQKFEDNLKDPERYAGQEKMAVKLNFLAPLYGYTEIGFEKSTGVGKGFELSLGVIGAGKAGLLTYFGFGSGTGLGEVKRSPFGLFVSGGFKFSKLPDFILFGKSRYTHLMQGTYIKPILYMGHYSENQIQEKSTNVFVTGKQNVTFGALQLEVGRQWVLGDKFMVDIYEGIGYGFDNKKDDIKYLNTNNNYFNDYSAFNYVNARGGKSPGFSVTYGIKVGWLLGKKKEK
jgi:hypothetical protein